MRGSVAVQLNVGMGKTCDFSRFEYGMIITDALVPASDKQPSHWGIYALQSLPRIAAQTKQTTTKSILTAAAAILGTKMHCRRKRSEESGKMCSC